MCVLELAIIVEDIKVDWSELDKKIHVKLVMESWWGCFYGARLMETGCGMSVGFRLPRYKSYKCWLSKELGGTTPVYRCYIDVSGNVLSSVALNLVSIKDIMMVDRYYYNFIVKYNARLKVLKSGLYK